MANIIEVKKLSKQFGTKKVVQEISFAVEKGDLFAFLGQNGAGKSTTINMIVGLLKKDSGEILYEDGRGFETFKHKIGVVFQNNVSDDLLTVYENLSFHGAMYGLGKREVEKRVQELTSLFGLDDVLGQRFKVLSGGQKRKVEIARALFMKPELLFLDEPTTGLDPKTRAEVWALIHQLKEERGLTIFLTTHYMEETTLADQVAIIDHGKIVASGTPQELKHEFTYDKLYITPHDANTFEQQLEARGLTASKTADTYLIKMGETRSSIELLHEWKEHIKFFEMLKGSMDDVFLNVIGEAMVAEEGIASKAKASGLLFDSK